MKKAIITDVTLRADAENGEKLSFKEKTEVAKLLDKLGVDVIEVGKISDRADTLFLHTIGPVIKNSIVSCNAGLSEETAEKAFEAISGCAKKRLNVAIPASTVQMEYVCGKKSAVVLEILDTMTKKCASLCADSEVSFIDATRAEKDFLYTAIKTAVANGIKNITLCDNAGDMLPDDMASFVADVIREAELSEGINLYVECSDKLGLGISLAASAIKAGACGVKAAFAKKNAVSVCDFANLVKSAGDRLGISAGVDMTALSDTESKIAGILGMQKSVAEKAQVSKEKASDDMLLSENDTIYDINAATAKLGYDLSAEDSAHVYDEFKKVAAKKNVSMHELDAIIAAVALQVPSTYRLKSFVINNGNVITATAHIELTKNGEVLSGFSTGDGPIDAAFRAIEQIIGHHYDLDDFSIQALTEGKEAVGTSIVKLRAASGKLYSGQGVSTDIIGGAVKAYLNALNKICFEEN